MASNPVVELASTIQSVHIRPSPSIDHDIAPQTSVDTKLPIDILPSTAAHHPIVTTAHHPTAGTTSATTHQREQQQQRHRQQQQQTDPETSSQSSHSLSSATSTIPSDIIIPRARRRTLPPFPDFRFEQSYLASIKTATSGGQVIYITVRDQVLWPLVSGIAYNLLTLGWRHWNRDVKLQGKGLGAKLRRWWWEVNHWVVPGSGSRDAKKVKDEVVKRAESFYVDIAGSGGD